MRRHSNRAMIQCAKRSSAIENERSRPSFLGRLTSVICPLIGVPRLHIEAFRFPGET